MYQQMGRWTVILVLCGFVSACGGSNGAQATAVPASAASHLPACANAGAPVALPPDFPAGFPLPPQTVITHQEQLGEGRLVIGGIIPTDLRAATAFFLRELPAAGYQLVGGDSERDEAESSYEGNGYRGQWKVHSILDCPNAVTLTISVQPVNAG